MALIMEFKTTCKPANIQQKTRSERTHTYRDIHVHPGSPKFELPSMPKCEDFLLALVKGAYGLRQYVLPVDVYGSTDVSTPPK